jgi:hypothetical protein
MSTIDERGHLTKPFTASEVMELNRYQNSGWHPFTCGNDRGNEAHRKYQREYGGDWGQLIATPDGWICPVCSYTQPWAHPMMANGSMVGGPLAVVGMGPKGSPEPLFEPFKDLKGLKPSQVQFTIYDHPDDYKDYFVVRRWELYATVPGPQLIIPGEHRFAKTLEEARALVPPGMVCIARAKSDDKFIVETWI